MTVSRMYHNAILHTTTTQHGAGVGGIWSRGRIFRSHGGLQGEQAAVSSGPALLRKGELELRLRAACRRLVLGSILEVNKHQQDTSTL